MQGVRKAPCDIEIFEFCIGGDAACCFNAETATHWPKSSTLVESDAAAKLRHAPQCGPEPVCIWGSNGTVGPRTEAAMRFVSLRILVALGATVLLSAPDSAAAQSVDPKAGTTRQQTSNSEGQQKIDEFAEAVAKLGGPAANPECVWLGRRVVGLLWRDDLDTAFRHLDLYDRFGCPAGHIQATFRCLVRQGSIDLKTPDTLSGRVHACWLDPSTEAKQAAPATPPGAVGQSKTTNR